MSDKIVIRACDLPKQVELVGERGERRIFELLPARRRFGLLLNAVGGVGQRIGRLGRRD